MLIKFAQDDAFTSIIRGGGKHTGVQFTKFPSFCKICL